MEAEEHEAGPVAVPAQRLQEMAEGQHQAVRIEERDQRFENEKGQEQRGGHVFAQVLRHRKYPIPFLLTTVPPFYH